MTDERIVAVTLSSAVPKAMSQWLDAIRGLAALLVVLAHVSQTYFGPQALASDAARQQSLWLTLFSITASQGHTAVIVFFVLSGFLVGGPSLRAAYERRFDAFAYGVARVTRIVPVAVFAIFVSVLLAIVVRDLTGVDGIAFRTAFFGNHTTTSLTQSSVIVYNLLFLQWFVAPPVGSNVALWSLACEGWFYVLFPLLFTAVIDRRLPMLLLAGLAIGVLAAPNPLMFTIYFAIWAFGAFAFQLLVAGDRRQIVRAGTAVLSLALVIFLLRKIEVLGSANRATRDIQWGLFTTVLLLALHSNARPLPAALNRVARFFGDISYSVYAFHLPFVMLGLTVC